MTRTAVAIIPRLPGAAEKTAQTARLSSEQMACAVPRQLKGLSSLQLSRNLGLHAKTAFVLLHKLRFALTSNSATTTLNGVVEIDGGWFGGYQLVAGFSDWSNLSLYL